MLGTDQSEDVLCAEFPDEPKWMGGAEVWNHCAVARKHHGTRVVHMDALVA